MDGNKRSRVVLLYGGQSGEHEVSLMSAASVLNAIDKARYDVTPIGGDKTGRWFISAIDELLAHDPHSLTPSLPASKEIALSTQFFKDYDVVLPIMHGPLFEDGCLQGFLDLCDIPYVGSGTQSSACAMDKVLSKQLALLHDVKIVDFKFLKAEMSSDKRQAIIKGVIDEFGFPLFVKPARMGSSVGIEKVNSEIALNAAIDNTFCFDEKILIERFLKGREIELAVLETAHELKVSLAGEIKMANEHDFYSYEAKYVDEASAQLIWPAALEDSLLKQLQDTALKVFQILECSGLARCDFFVESETNTVYFNEINTLPGFTEISMYPKLWAKSGLPYDKLISVLIESALHRYDKRKKLVRDIK